jgi:hypothetical protein
LSRSIAPGFPTAYHQSDFRAGHESKGKPMKKLLIILILAAIGIAVVKKVREA